MFLVFFFFSEWQLATEAVLPPSRPPSTSRTSSHDLGTMEKVEKFFPLFFVSAQEITDLDRKHSFLLHFAGKAVQDLFKTPNEPVPVVDDRFERTVSMLGKHLNVTKNTPFERHCFRHMAPTVGETVDKSLACVFRPNIC